MQEKSGLEGQHVMVIGGASGIGLAVAQGARQRGARVTIASSNRTRVAEAAKANSFEGGSVDLRGEADVERFFEEVGAFDHLAITAGDWGGFMFGSVRELDLAEAREGFAVRFWGVLAAVKFASRRIDAGGSITLTSGMLAHRPVKGAPLAAALGGAVEHLTRGLAVDLEPVRINAVCPGIILTEHVVQTMPQERLAAYVNPLPIARGASPEEAALAYLYLMQNRYLTGHVLPVDGGGMLV